MAMPKTTNGQAAKLMKAIGKPYEVLANAFKDKNSERLYAEFHAAQTVWQNVSLCRPRVVSVIARTRG